MKVVGTPIVDLDRSNILRLSFLFFWTFEATNNSDLLGMKTWCRAEICGITQLWRRRIVVTIFYFSSSTWILRNRENGIVILYLFFSYANAFFQSFFLSFFAFFIFQMKLFFWHAECVCCWCRLIIRQEIFEF